jgi:putative hydrolase of the HAD superfamily
MQFYRRLTTIKAISFDLDDTLYNNLPVMFSIEKKMVSYFAEKLARLLPDLQQVYNRHFWGTYRQDAINANSDISHDVVQLRFESYRLGLIAHGLPAAQAASEAQLALNYFIKLRSDFSVPEASKQLLARLSKQYPLVAISNGNVDTKAIGIAHYFQHIYHAGYQNSDHQAVAATLSNGSLLKQKPATDMFAQVCQQLAISPSQLLHVGDCGFADIHGALNAGCQTAWLSFYDVGKPLKQLPHIELSNVSQLLSLLK